MYFYAGEDIVIVDPRPNYFHLGLYYAFLNNWFDTFHGSQSNTSGKTEMIERSHYPFDIASAVKRQSACYAIIT